MQEAADTAPMLAPPGPVEATSGVGDSHAVSPRIGAGASTGEPRVSTPAARQSADGDVFAQAARAMRAVRRHLSCRRWKVAWGLLAAAAAVLAVAVMLRGVIWVREAAVTAPCFVGHRGKPQPPSTCSCGMLVIVWQCWVVEPDRM